MARFLQADCAPLAYLGVLEWVIRDCDTAPTTTLFHCDIRRVSSRPSSPHSVENHWVPREL
eukprot:m.470110 g.470110  ORF g.470110 m.470110 type:complete len:61 (+) comp29397_c0_seq1:290-472(+)